MVERAYLVGVAMPEETDAEAHSLLEELEALVGTLKIGIVGKEQVRVRQPHPHALLGRGQMRAIIAAAKRRHADCLVLDAELTPAQQRNWEAASNLCVLGREEVILDIFSERARTREAVLQVDLARAEHALPRLKNAWSHLSRQRGGGGITQRGEGEAQIELDARLVRQRIARLKKELAAVIAAIVGDTNAGKSTLLNALTGANVLAEDKLFATLDPTTRQMRLPSGQKLLLTDTVGFVRRLPHQLVDAFKATLEEAVLADFLIHVVDASHPESREQSETTLRVLHELGADEKRIITVHNKIDLCARPLEAPHRAGQPIPVSARTGAGLPLLVAACEALLEDRVLPMELEIPFDRYQLVSQLHEIGAVQGQRAKDGAMRVTANLPVRLQHQYGPYRVTGEDA